MCLIAIIFTLIIVNLFKKFPGKDIIDVSEFLVGNGFKYIVGIFICINIVLVASILLRDFVEVVHIIYYSDTPIIFMLFFFIVVCIIANLFGGAKHIKNERYNNYSNGSGSAYYICFCYSKFDSSKNISDSGLWHIQNLFYRNL